MVRSRSPFGNSRAVLFSRVAFIVIPIIIRELLMKTIHIIISIGFSQYGSGSYRKILPVSFDYCRMGDIGIFIETVAVNEQMLRPDRELANSPMHGQKRGTENIYLINLLGRHHSYRPCYRLFLYHFPECIALLFCQLLRVIQQLILKIFRKNDGSSIHRTCQTAAPSLITAGFYQIFI